MNSSQLVPPQVILPALPVDSVLGPDGGAARGLGRRPWLPRGMSFLSDLPEAARKRRFLMPVQIFADHSSDDGLSGHFVMAGLLSHSENWAAFSDEWNVCLRAEPRVAYFRMSEAASCGGEFYRFRVTWLRATESCAYWPKSSIATSGSRPTLWWI